MTYRTRAGQSVVSLSRASRAMLFAFSKQLVEVHNRQLYPEWGEVLLPLPHLGGEGL